VHIRCRRNLSTTRGLCKQVRSSYCDDTNKDRTFGEDGGGAAEECNEIQTVGGRALRYEADTTSKVEMPSGSKIFVVSRFRTLHADPATSNRAEFCPNCPPAVSKGTSGESRRDTGVLQNPVLATIPWIKPTKWYSTPSSITVLLRRYCSSIRGMLLHQCSRTTLVQWYTVPGTTLYRVEVLFRLPPLLVEVVELS
jgi:hypothetical protein